jgi:hypothetical protein
MLKSANTDRVTELAWDNPYHELYEIRRGLKDAVDDLRAQVNGLEGSERLAMMELVGLAKEASSAGYSSNEILYACCSGYSGMDKTASVVMSDLATGMARNGISLSTGKHAEAYYEVSDSHPLPTAFAKVADLRRNRVHLEYALSDLEEKYKDVNHELLSILR